MTTYGLPRQVTSLLRHLEAYKEFLKWDINESTHKITLTLSWNFRKHAGRETLWHRLQRTLHLSHNESTIPTNLTRFLDASPRKSHPHRSNSLFSRPNLNWARLSSISLPSRFRHNQSPTTHRNSFRESTSMHGSFRRASPSHLSLPVSPSRYSWHGTGHAASSPSDMADPVHSTPITSTPDSIRSSDLSPSRVKLSYRCEEELEQSMEDLTKQFQEQNRQELKNIRKEWDSAIKNWTDLINEPEHNTSSEQTDNNSEENVNLQHVNKTVQRCLETCDSILDKNSTLIL